MYAQFIDKRFNAKSEQKLEWAEAIIAEYQASGDKLSLRQLYYQFVARDLIPNKQSEYKKLGSLISDARLAGRISWDIIEDRGRDCTEWLINESTYQAVNGVHRNIGWDYWERQNRYVEVWVEKESLAPTIATTCSKYKVPYMACKGYLSTSEAYAAGQRFQRMAQEGRECWLIHLGDHDPSGIDMTRDNDDRLDMLSYQAGVMVDRLALNRDQIDEHRPPPNPVKFKDTRAKDYIHAHGRASWELDALPPNIIRELLDERISLMIDDDEWEECSQAEDEERQVLRKLQSNWHDIERHIKKEYM